MSEEGNLKGANTDSFSENSFDALFSENLFDYADEIQPIFSEAARVLKPEGLYSFNMRMINPECTSFSQNLYDGLKAELKRLKLGMHLLSHLPAYAPRMTYPALYQLLENQGFEIEDSYEQPNFITLQQGGRYAQETFSSLFMALSKAIDQTKALTLTASIQESVHEKIPKSLYDASHGLFCIRKRDG